MASPEFGRGGNAVPLGGLQHAEPRQLRYSGQGIGFGICGVVSPVITDSREIPQVGHCRWLFVVGMGEANRRAQEHRDSSSSFNATKILQIEQVGSIV